MKKEYQMKDVVKVLLDNGYRAVGWKGSHLRLQRGAVIIHVSRNTRFNQYYTHHVFKKAGIDIHSLDE
jgi:predicted RNA binding protein YcfA (HicA-like mRNA interferase family)